MASNVPIAGAGKSGDIAGAHVLLDLGDDEYTVGRPHPMIDPSLRDDMLRRAFDDGETGVILVDVVIGYGAHEAPAAELVAQLPPEPRKATVVASVCGTEADPQGYARQVSLLRDAGVIVAPSNAHAAAFAAALIGHRR